MHSALITAILCTKQKLGSSAINYFLSTTEAHTDDLILQVIHNRLINKCLIFSYVYNREKFAITGCASSQFPYYSTIISD